MSIIHHKLNAASGLLPANSYAYEATYSSTSSATTYTFNSCDIGTAASNRVVVVTVHASGNLFSSGSITSVTIAGTAATQAVQSPFNNNFTRSAVFYLPVATGTTATIVVNLTGGQTAARCVISTYSLYGLSFKEDVATDAAPNASGNNTVQSITNSIYHLKNTIIIGTGMINGTTTETWTNLTENDGRQVGTRRVSSASERVTTAGSRTITFASNLGSNATMQLVTAAFR